MVVPPNHPSHWTIWVMKPMGFWHPFKNPPMWTMSKPSSVSHGPGHQVIHLLPVLGTTWFPKILRFFPENPISFLFVNRMCFPSMLRCSIANTCQRNQKIGHGAAKLAPWSTQCPPAGPAQVQLEPAHWNVDRNDRSKCASSYTCCFLRPNFIGCTVQNIMRSIVHWHAANPAKAQHSNHQNDHPNGFLWK